MTTLKLRRLSAAAIVIAAAAILAPTSPATAAGARLTVTPTTVAAGTSVTVSWAGVGRPTVYDWVGLYASPEASDSAFLAWRYTTGATSGSFALKIPSSSTPRQTYELRLFANNGFTRIATSQSIFVHGAATLSAPERVLPGNVTTVSWAGVSAPTSLDWIGLYRSPAAADDSFIAWKYTGGGSGGSVPFIVPSGATPAPRYEFRLFANNGYVRLAVSDPVTVGASLFADPSYAAGQAANVHWAGVPAPTATDWIGLYASSTTADNAFAAWAYTTGGASGSRSLVVPAGTAPSSTYEFRLFSNNGYTRLGTSTPFTVF